ncbi:MAG: hypothetical protein OEZ22_07880 [Spirochaetia bacterium]|nr:hypothetical protein [Spirochaetia bacterium]
MKEIEIAKVLGLAKKQKYEVTCASFDLVDHIFKVDLPRSLKNRKLAVQAMSLLAEGHIKYGFEKFEDNPKEETAKKQSEEE